jgi:Holliday junction resolvasome RuvABC endonuclease subunit
MNAHTILGIDPGTKEMGIAVLSGPRLLDHNVHTLRNGDHPYDIIAQARSVVLGYIKEYGPQVIAIEKPYLLPTKRAALLSVIEQELAARAGEPRLTLVELTPEEIRQTVTGNLRATKLAVATALAQVFPLLAGKVPRPPTRAALGLRSTDRYWLHMFDALALCVAVRDRFNSSGKNSPMPNASLAATDSEP